LASGPDSDDEEPTNCQPIRIRAVDLLSDCASDLRRVTGAVSAAERPAMRMAVEVSRITGARPGSAPPSGEAPGGSLEVRHPERPLAEEPNTM